MKGGGGAIAGRGRAAALLALLLVAVSLHADAAVPRRLLEADHVATQQQSPPLPAAKGHQPPPLLSVRQASAGPSCGTNDPHIHDSLPTSPRAVASQPAATS
jgi:hypothetical protein